MARHQSMEKNLIDGLPEECLNHIFSFLSEPADRCRCAAVSRKWLVFQLNVRRHNLLNSNPLPLLRFRCDDEDDDDDDDDDEESGEVSRCLQGRKANDFRLAALAIGVHPRVLTELELIANLPATRPLDPPRRHEVVTDTGLGVIGSTCPGLKSISIWSCSYVTDAGLAHIARGCPGLEELCLSALLVQDSGVAFIAKNCTKLNTLSLDSCLSVGDGSLRAVADHSSQLRQIFLTKCPRITDSGIIPLVLKLRKLQRMKLESATISDDALRAIAQHAVSLEKLWLQSIAGGTEIGYSLPGAAQKLKVLSLVSCSGLTDKTFAVLPATCFGNLLKIKIKHCPAFTDLGLIELTKRTGNLTKLAVAQCHKITAQGLATALLNCADTLKILSLMECNLLVDPQQQQSAETMPTLDALKINKCEGVERAFLKWIVKACKQAKKIFFVDMSSLDDDTLLVFFESLGVAPRVTRLNLSGCVKISEQSVLPMLTRFGIKLKWLSLAGCKEVSDLCLGWIGTKCTNLEDLNLCRCQVSDETLLMLATAPEFKLTTLAIAGCDRVTDAGLAYLENMGSSVRALNLMRCSGITRGAIEHVKDALWWCDIDA